MVEIDEIEKPLTLLGGLETTLQGPMRPGSILMHAPSHVFQAMGGGENQLVQTARNLVDLGAKVRLFIPWIDRLDQSRLLHLFGMSREGLELAKVAKAKGVPVAVSPIFWSSPRSIWALQPSWTRRLSGLAAWTMRRSGWSRHCWRSELLRLADVVLPNSRREARQLTRLFGVPPHKIAVIPNGVDPRFSQGDPHLARNVLGIEDDFVLYSGRIEERKNVLGLIEATQSLGYHLIVIGEPVPGHLSYWKACQKAGADQVRFLGRVDHHDPLLASAYSAARVFALPSWFETPGLSALEAGLAGAAVVVTPYGSALEYFGRRAWYARPDHPEEVRRQIDAAWKSETDLGLAELVGSRYLWSTVARLTQDAYDRIAPDSL